MINMESSVRQLIKGPRLRKGPKVGIELEYEKAPVALFEKKLRDWNIVQDHSLRQGGAEFVSRVLNPEHVSTALRLALAQVTENKLVVNKRCGVHVHVNASDLTLEEFWCWLTLYMILEPYIFNHFAKGREENHFCLPIMYNDWFVYSMEQAACALLQGIEFSEKQPTSVGGNINTARALFKCSKYSSVNLSCFSKFGSIEFRQMAGTKSKKRLQEWVDFLIQLRQEAITYASQNELIEEFMTYGARPFLRKFDLPSYEVAPDIKSKIIDNIFFTQGVLPVKHTELKWK